MLITGTILTMKYVLTTRVHEITHNVGGSVELFMRWLGGSTQLL